MNTRAKGFSFMPNNKGMIQDVLMSFIYLGIVAVITFTIVSISSEQAGQFLDTHGSTRLLAIHALRTQHTTTITQLPNSMTSGDALNSRNILASPCLAVGIQFRTESCNDVKCQYNSDANTGCETKVVGGDCAYARLRPLAEVKGTLIKTSIATNTKPIGVEAVFAEQGEKTCVKN